MAAPANYHRLSIGQKQALHRDRMREPAVTCPVCETQTTAADLLEHIETRCPGPREPSPASSWIRWRQALAMGVPRGTLSRWVKRDLVRTRGERQDRVYLLRDLAVHVAARRAQQQRQFHEWNRPEDGGSAALAAPNSDGSSTSGTRRLPSGDLMRAMLVERDGRRAAVQLHRAGAGGWGPSAPVADSLSLAHSTDAERLLPLNLAAGQRSLDNRIDKISQE